MIIAPIKKKWLDMMLSGEKQEEYREIKSYWDLRLAKDLGFMKFGIPREKATEAMKQSMFSGKSYPCYVLDKNGYSSSCARYWLPCSVTIGKEMQSGVHRRYTGLHIYSIRRIPESTIGKKYGNCVDKRN